MGQSQPLWFPRLSRKTRDRVVDHPELPCGNGARDNGRGLANRQDNRLPHHPSSESIGGFSAELAAAVTIGLATIAKVPISTTHAIGGAVSGVGATRGWHAVRWIWGEKIIVAWIVTFPGAALIGAAGYAIGHRTSRHPAFYPIDSQNESSASVRLTRAGCTHSGLICNLRRATELDRLVDFAVPVGSGFPHDRARIFIIPQSHELCVAQVISAGPLQKLDLNYDARLHPDALIHLLCRESLSPAAGVLFG